MPPPDRLDQLRDRWRAEPSSRGFLQIAEEYRRDGRLADALGLLDEGLRQQPGYLAALVAKGRCLLELGQPAAAREALERVVGQDPTQAVATKLLVRAHLAAGEARQARERLERYGLLHGGDPEAQELEARIAALEGPAAASAPAARRDGAVFDLTPRPLPPPELLFPEAPPVPEPAAAVPAAAPEPEPEPEAEAEPVESPNGDPFPGLDTPESRRRYLEALTAEGIFFLDLPGAPPVEPVEAPPPAGAPAATVTLGQLYLEQGHAAEAQEIFTEVLRREPDNRAAQEALAGVERGAGDTLAARRAFALTRYLERLRRGSARHVP
ncbi:MAG TPA: tetratricopeptide repeat protein [Thermoanaerobaculia bacterium]|nr:tetratricopeptide repeat protein [Thermoanaerobaculia bacterium]